MRTALAAPVVVLLLAACSRSEPPPPPPAFKPTETALPVPASSPRPPPLIPPPAGEPPPDVVTALYREEMAEIAAAGGLPLVVSATGRQVTVMPKVHGAWMDECRRVPQSAPGHWECTLTVRLKLEEIPQRSLVPDTREPSLQGARLFVRWDGRAGRWVRG
jgi:hypothetical protein